jgi:hypothetical protein
MCDAGLSYIHNTSTVVSRYYGPIGRKTVKHVNRSGLSLVG